MKFWASAEVHMPAFDNLDRVRMCVEPHLNAAFESGLLRDSNITLRYIPIVMPLEMHERYKERWSIDRKTNVCVSGPYLSYETFVEGNWKDQIREYLRGIELSEKNLIKLGLTHCQMEQFREVIDGSHSITGLQ